MNEFDKNKLLDSTLKELGKVIRDDELITYDELELLKQVTFDVRRYERSLEKALEDSIITKEESDELNHLKEQILANVYKVAEWDGVLSDDEKRMIKKLSDILSQYFT
ncbi:MAG: hypothetical protein ACXAD7_10245 [Candidatus Kariarchaeaceae archaeon]|jgi:hypothetical protein